MKAPNEDSYINVDDISGLQRPQVWNTMAYLLFSHGFIFSKCKFETLFRQAKLKFRNMFLDLDETFNINPDPT